MIKHVDVVSALATSKGRKEVSYDRVDCNSDRYAIHSQPNFDYNCRYFGPDTSRICDQDRSRNSHYDDQDHDQTVFFDHRQFDQINQASLGVFLIGSGVV